MMGLSGSLLMEQAKKEKDVAGVDPLVSEVSLGSADLPK
tara:strand:- start:287 stop:403 length:117 start_codon:yes stop_codon:yes gene_type:complete